MPTFSRQLLTGSTNGRGILVVATATPGTLIHTAIAGTSDLDHVYLWAFNSDNADRVLTIEFGGVADPDDLVEVTIPKQGGWIPVVPGYPLQNTLLVRAFGSVASVLTLQGYINRRS